jgi:hypothetical protein
MNSLDWVILAPVIPVLPLLVTWWLPWERWIPWALLPKHLLGPYILYAAFAAWHFRMPGWTVALVAAIGLVVCLLAVREFLVFRQGAKIRPRAEP